MNPSRPIARGLLLAVPQFRLTGDGRLEDRSGVKGRSPLWGGLGGCPKNNTAAGAARVPSSDAQPPPRPTIGAAPMSANGVPR